MAQQARRSTYRLKLATKAAVTLHLRWVAHEEPKAKANDAERYDAI